MTRTNRILLTGYSLSLSLFLLGCGGGSSSTTTPTTEDTTEKTSYAVSGTVPGTLIEAFCKDGSYHKVNSTDDGTANHPFSIDIPSGVYCKFIMTTNEDDVDTSKHIVTPILWNNGTTRSSYFRLSADTSLGNIPLSLTGEGVQEPITVSTDDKTVHYSFFF